MAALFRREKEQPTDKSNSASPVPEPFVMPSPDQTSQQPQQNLEQQPQFEQLQPVEQQPGQQEQQPSPEQQGPGVRRTSGQQSPTPLPVPPVPQQMPAVKSDEQKEVESILSANLTEIYQGMTPQEQQKFREKGEEASAEITGLVGQFKASARKVLHIITGWLASIPRVNKFFLEQEAKLKTDQIMKYQRKLKKEKRNKRLGR